MTVGIHCICLCLLSYTILDMLMLTLMLIFSLWFFKIFKICLVLTILYCLKTYCYISIWPLIYLLALGRDRFCTVYICFKKTYFSIFHTNYLINISPYHRTYLKLVSATFHNFFIFNQMTALQKLWKMFFISSKKFFLFLKYSNFCISVFSSFSPCQPLF